MSNGTTRQQLALNDEQLGQLTDTGPNRGLLAAYTRFGSPEQKRAARTRLSDLSNQAPAAPTPAA